MVRYCDFLVNEVDTAGHVVRLTSLQSLSLAKPEPQAAASPAAQPASEGTGGEKSAAEGVSLNLKRQDLRSGARGLYW